MSACEHGEEKDDQPEENVVMAGVPVEGLAMLRQDPGIV